MVASNENDFLQYKNCNLFAGYKIITTFVTAFTKAAVIEKTMFG